MHVHKLVPDPAVRANIKQNNHQQSSELKVNKIFLLFMKNFIPTNLNALKKTLNLNLLFYLGADEDFFTTHHIKNICSF